ncbi:MAG: Cell shape-determining protein MreC [Magnetococcales bacterium]|nr:Cell shape-determining protein MreC [Magnetococcales bacterium]HIJ82703.1 rod shape-determining protein MreC [Magnetococcales bacterium]
MDFFLALIKEHRHSIVATATLVVSLLLLLAVRPGNRDPGFIEDAALDVVGGIQGVVQSPVGAYRDFTSQFRQWQSLLEENRRFSQELKILRPLGTQVVELEMENQRLRRLLKMPLPPQLHSLAARVVGDTSTAFANVLLLDVGRNQGSRVNASVLVPKGVVGRVVQVGNNTSLVLTLLDINSRVPVLVQRTRTNGTLAGFNGPTLTMENVSKDAKTQDVQQTDTTGIIAGFNGQSLSMDYVSKDAKIKAGDTILTSGMAGSFPKGLPIGIVKEVLEGDTGLFQRVIIQPSVDFDRVEEVRLLIPGKLSTTADLPKQSDTMETP